MNETPSHFIAVCPSCLARLKVNYEYSGKLVRCRFCDEAFRPFSPDFGEAAGSAEYAVGPVAPPEDESELIVACPSCETTLSVRSRYAGRYVRCGACREKFLVDAGSAASAGGDVHVDPPDPGEQDDRTPDPDVRRSELARLAEEVVALRERVDLLLGRNEELRREVESLRAQVRRLESDREAADGRLDELSAHIAREARRPGPVGLAPLDEESEPEPEQDRDDDRRTTVPFVQERSAASGL
jgi:uncharacterized protein YbaR (Trm112 family)